jgi:hypothetical protein
MPSSSHSFALALGASLLTACGGSSVTPAAGGGEDGGDVDGGTTTGDAAGGGDGGGAGVACALSYSAFNASPKVNAQSTSSWTCTATTRLMTGNGIPEHSVVGGNFATPISAQSLSVTFPLAPAISSPTGTALVRKPYGFALNSVKLDPGTDGTCSSTATSTAPGGGCVAIMGRDPWNLEALGGAFKFGADENNAHVQPNGQYHYHGMPEGSLAKAGMAVTLIGFAMDGFPIYARYGFTTATDASSPVKVMTSSYQKKANPDAGRPPVDIFPMGTFTQDYEYVAGSGDLDECNGRTGVTPDFPSGTYHYLITDTFPFIQRCLKGSPL